MLAVIIDNASPMVKLVERLNQYLDYDEDFNQEDQAQAEAFVEQVNRIQWVRFKEFIQ